VSGWRSAALEVTVECRKNCGNMRPGAEADSGQHDDKEEQRREGEMERAFPLIHGAVVMHRGIRVVVEMINDHRDCGDQKEQNKRRKSVMKTFVKTGVHHFKPGCPAM